jgi:hypothetical protein
MKRRIDIVLLAVGLVLPAATSAAAHTTRRASAKRVATSRPAHRRNDQSNDIHVTRKRLGTLRHRGVSVSGLGAVSCLFAGPIGWGIYRGVDMMVRR